jgi:hypothetical protein
MVLRLRRLVSSAVCSSRFTLSLLSDRDMPDPAIVGSFTHRAGQTMVEQSGWLEHLHDSVAQQSHPFPVGLAQADRCEPCVRMPAHVKGPFDRTTTKGSRRVRKRHAATRIGTAELALKRRCVPAEGHHDDYHGKATVILH